MRCVLKADHVAFIKPAPKDIHIYSLVSTPTSDKERKKENYSLRSCVPLPTLSYSEELILFNPLFHLKN